MSILIKNSVLIFLWMSLSACSASQADIVPACKKFISDNFRASAAEKTCTCVSDEIGNVIDKKFNKEIIKDFTLATSRNQWETRLGQKPYARAIYSTVGSCYVRNGGSL